MADQSSNDSKTMDVGTRLAFDRTMLAWACANGASQNGKFSAPGRIAWAAVLRRLTGSANFAVGDALAFLRPPLLL